jgi:hypothetical protein
MKFHLLLIISISILLSACQTCRNTVKSQSVREIIITNSFVNDSMDDSFKIEHAEIQNKELLITVTFKGDSNKHEFDLLWNGAIMKSLPPKATLTLVRKSASEKEKKHIRMVLKFDLSVLSERIPNTESVVLILSGFETHLSYKLK